MQVSIGTDDLLSIVCGAPNCRVGLCVAVATVGAVLPGDFQIQASELRGQMSFGMLCSRTELGFDEAQDGIWELPEDAPLGMDLRAYLALDDEVIDVDLTPNRADCFSIRGLARELSVLTGQVLQGKSMATVQPTQDRGLSAHVHDAAACPRYLTQVITDINIQALTPVWMQEKLRRGGIRCLHPVVDVLNLVMLELGQPMHAFDLHAITGDLQVRLAKDGECLTLLKVMIALQPNTYC